MARRERIHFPGALYHVILRGNAGDQVFFDDLDRQRLYLIIQFAVERFRCRIHAFCLMRNHLHLVVQVDDIPLSAIMQNMALRYTKWINYRRNRTGHLFQGRYKAILVDADAYLLELVRYVHLNPVRAGASSTPEDYPWSGHRCYLGTESIPWLTTGPVLSLLAPASDKARKAYAAFVRDGMEEGRRVEFHTGTCEGRILGDEHFSDNILTRTDQKGEREYAMAEVIEAACAYCQISPEQLQAPGKHRPMTRARGIAAAIVQMSPHLRLTDLARLVGRDLSALGKAAQRVTAEPQGSSAVRSLVAGLKAGNKGMSKCQT